MPEHMGSDPREVIACCPDPLYSPVYFCLYSFPAQCLPSFIAENIPIHVNDLKAPVIPLSLYMFQYGSSQRNIPCRSPGFRRILDISVMLNIFQCAPDVYNVCFSVYIRIFKPLHFSFSHAGPEHNLKEMI